MARGARDPAAGPRPRAGGRRRDPDLGPSRSLRAWSSARPGGPHPGRHEESRSAASPAWPRTPASQGSGRASRSTGKRSCKSGAPHLIPDRFLARLTQRRAQTTCATPSPCPPSWPCGSTRTSRPSTPRCAPPESPPRSHSSHSSGKQRPTLFSDPHSSGKQRPTLFSDPHSSGKQRPTLFSDPHSSGKQRPALFSDPHSSGKQRPTLFSDPPHCASSLKPPTRSSRPTVSGSKKHLDQDGYSLPAKTRSCASSAPCWSRLTKNGPRKRRPTPSGNTKMYDRRSAEFPDNRLLNRSGHASIRWRLAALTLLGGASRRLGGFDSPGDCATFKFPPTPRHDPRSRLTIALGDHARKSPVVAIANHWCSVIVLSFVVIGRGTTSDYKEAR